MTLGIYYEHMLAAARQREATLPALCAKVRALGYEAVAPQAAHIVRDAGLLPMLSSAGLQAEGIYERFLFEDKAQTAQQTAQVLAVCERAGSAGEDVLSEARGANFAELLVLHSDHAVCIRAAAA